MTENSPRGLQAERTRLAWQRSALGAGVVSLLLLYQTAYTGWGVLAGAGAWRARHLRGTSPPRPIPAPVLGAVAGLITAAAMVVLFTLPW